MSGRFAMRVPPRLSTPSHPRRPAGSQSLTSLSEKFGLAEPVAGDKGNHYPISAMSSEYVQVFGHEAWFAADEAAFRVLDRDSEHAVRVRQ